jgi:hypothetical protein
VGKNRTLIGAVGKQLLDSTSFKTDTKAGAVSFEAIETEATEAEASDAPVK